jgi:hypothetical protein
MENLKMKHHSAWLAACLLLFVVLACNLSKNKNANLSSNTNSTPDVEEGSGTFIKEIHMAKDNGRGAPGDKTDSFAPDDRTIHSVATLKESKAGTQMMFSWWIVDADGTKNKKFKDIDYTTGALENVVHGHLTAPKDWPPGKYKVQVYVNGNLDKTIGYTVE